MSTPNPPEPERLLATMRRHLASADPYQQAGAAYSALRAAEAAAEAAWSRAGSQSPKARTLLALRAAVELLEGLAAELAGDQGAGEGRG
jgi:hypothetical protein